MGGTHQYVSFSGFVIDPHNQYVHGRSHQRVHEPKGNVSAGTGLHAEHHAVGVLLRGHNDLIGGQHGFAVRTGGQKCGRR